MTERLHFHFSLLCIGEGNGNPFQCSCLENPRDGGAWWAAVYGVSQSQTRLKRLSSSSSRWVLEIFMSKNVQDLVVDWQWYKEEGAVKGDSNISGLPTIDHDRKTLQEGQVWGR